MTSREFSQLVAACGMLARRSPLAYRFRVLLLAALGYAYIGCVLALLGAAISFLLWIVSGSGGGIASLQLGLPLIGAIWIALRSLHVELPAPHGVELKRSVEPRLFEEIEEIRRALGAPRIDRVVLDNDLNASVIQYPRWGPFGQRNILLLGNALLSTLTLDEFRSVVAHELGHVARGHGRFAIWIYRIRIRWMQLLDGLGARSHWSAFLYRRFFEWYAPYFHAYSLVLSREHEFDADRATLAIAGAEALADGLARKAVTDRFLLLRFQPLAQRLPAQRTEPPPDFPGLFRQAARRALESPTAESWLRQALAGTTHVEDSHPSLSDRIQSVGISAPDPAVWCRRLAVHDAARLAETLLVAGEDHAARLAAEWLEATVVPWAEQRHHFEQLRTELAAIESGAASRDNGSAIRRVELISALEGPHQAREDASALVARDPGDAEARFLLGGILAELDSPESIEHLERAMVLDPALVRLGLPLGRSLLRRLGRDADATAFEHRWEEAVAESTESVWTSPMSGADRARIRAAAAHREVISPVRGSVLFRHASTGGTHASAILLAVAGIMLAFFVWAYVTPILVPVILIFVSAGTAIGCLLAFMVLRRMIRGEVELLETGVHVRVGRLVRTMDWSDVRDWKIRRRELVLLGVKGRVRLSVRPAEFARLCEEVAKRVIARRGVSTGPGPIDPATAMRSARRVPSKVFTFRRRRHVLAFAGLAQLVMVVAGAFNSVELYILGMIGLAVTAWRIAKSPFAVSVGLRWIRVERPTGTESILLAALAGVDVVPLPGGFVVLVYNRFGEPRAVPAVDGNVLGLYDAISANLEAARDSAAAGSAPARRAPRRLQMFRPAVALAFAVLFYLPILSGLTVSETARTGSIPAVRFLLAIGAPVDGRGVGGRTPLYRAAMYGHMELAKMLVRLGADPSFGSGPTEASPLHAAAGHNERDMVEYLLNLGVDPDIANLRRETPLDYLSSETAYGDNLAAARLLLDRGATVDSRSITGSTPLHSAVTASNRPLVELLVSRGADIDASGSDGTPLHLAAAANDVAMTELLLRLGASIDVRRDRDGRTPLAHAADLRSQSVVRLLLDRGADPDIPDVHGYRPVHLLLMSGADVETMKALLDHGADPNAVGYGDLRALPGAISRQRDDLALALLDAGADPDAAAAGWTPLRMAFRMGDQEMIDELYRRGAK